MRAILVFACLLIFPACASPAPHEAMPAGRLLFSYRFTNDAFVRAVRAHTGYFFYEEAGLVTCYRQVGGKIVEVKGGRPDRSAGLLRDLGKIRFEAFDYDTELAAVRRAIQEKVERTGQRSWFFAVVDGNAYELRLVFGDIDFMAKGSELESEIDAYAPHSEKVKRLQAVLDLFQHYYGKDSFDR